MNNLWKFTLVSLLLHFLLGGSVFFWPQNPKNQNLLPVEITLVEKPKTKSGPMKQVVRQALVPEQQQKPFEEDPLAFLSEQTQRVKKQMQAATKGITANRSDQSKTTKTKSSDKNSHSESQKKLGKIAEEFNSDDPDSIAKGKTADGSSALNSPLSLQSEKGLSTVGEALPTEVGIGSFTALNTDRFVHYSFFKRIEDLIRFRWESMVRQIDESTLVEGSTRVWITQIEVLLNSKGEFQKALLMKPSGKELLDSAAIQAFRQAGFFPNPPKAMVEDDGFIHLRYSFHVTAPKVLARP